MARRRDARQPGQKVIAFAAWLLLLVGGLVLVDRLRRQERRTAVLEREIARLHDRLIAIDPGLASPAPPRPVAPPAAEAEPPRPEPVPDPVATGAPPADPEPLAEPQRWGGFETLVGGKLPIWIGGVALVFAAFFLVRYSIESGLLGPGIRVALAALFAVALVGAAEAARRLPATAEDPRVAQALAGAGVAAAYATLYLAAAGYQLVGPITAFLLTALVTIAALVLSLRHGAPTAVMALVGGFAAPLVAGIDSAGIAPLLAYLALLIGALFGLAAHRGWRWLVIAATIAGFGWVNLIWFLVDGDSPAALAGFTVALALGARLVLPASGMKTPRWSIAPIVAGVVQLLALSPALRLDALAWGYFLTLDTAAVALARLRPALRPAAPGAALLTVLLLAIGFDSPGAATPLAAIYATALLGGAGFAWSRLSRNWAMTALAGLAGPILAALAFSPARLPPLAWTLLALPAAAACAALAWRHRDRAGERDPGLVGGTATAALLGAIALAQPLPPSWAALPILAALAGLLAWARLIEREEALWWLPSLAAAALLANALEPLVDWLHLIEESLAGLTTPYPLLPALPILLPAVLLPALGLAAALLITDSRAFGRARRAVIVIAATFTIYAAYALAKAPLAIATPERFMALGFDERALITLASLGLALLSWRHRPAWRPLALALAALGLARLVWFDFLVLSPLATPQSVGGLPLFNAAVLLPALAAAVFWGLRTLHPAARPLSLLLSLAAALALVRQLAHGTIITGPVGPAENIGYSAAALAVALAWLGWGMRSGARDLRLAGLLLLTLVTAKVFLVDASSLGGLLRSLSFLGLGIALIGIGWLYGRVLGRQRPV